MYCVQTCMYESDVKAFLSVLMVLGKKNSGLPCAVSGKPLVCHVQLVGHIWSAMCS